jgi:predicted DNA-binding transcriptional regulator AlpA
LGVQFLWSPFRAATENTGTKSMTVMTDANKNPFDMLLDSIRIIVREEITAATGTGTHNDIDRLLTADEAAAILGVNVRWLYRHAAKLPFTRRISRKNRRFSEAGLRRWIAAKKPGPR